MFKIKGDNPINVLPDHIMARIKPLDGRVVKFKTKALQYDKISKKEKPPYMVAVPSNDRIIDPKTNEIHKIGFVTNVDTAGNAVLDTPWFDSLNGGMIIIAPNPEGQYSANDILLYEYLSLCNFNESNPYRDTSQPARFEEINDDEIANKKVEKIGTSLDAGMEVIKLSDEDVAIVCSQLQVGEVQDSKGTLRLKLVNFAQAEPDKFAGAKMVLDEIGRFVIDINAALEKKVIGWDRRGNTAMKHLPSGEIFWKSDQKGLSDVENIQKIARWFKTDTEGAGVYVTIKSQL
jgi:hypothetical protein